MSDLMTAGLALAGLNTAMTLALGAVYVRNHAEIRSPFTLGLVIFAAFLLLHNGMAVYYGLTMVGVSAPLDAPFVLLENLLQACALAALLVATLR